MKVNFVLRFSEGRFLSVSGVILAMAGPRPVVMSGPSGAGKSTLLKKLLNEFDGVFGFSVSRKSHTEVQMLNSSSLVEIENKNNHELSFIRYDAKPPSRRGERQRLGFYSWVLQKTLHKTQQACFHNNDMHSLHKQLFE